MNTTSERNQDWINRWKEGRTGFHRTEVNPLLEKYFPRLRSDEDASQVESILVPLCGKTRDMAWLRGRGLRVVGIELAEQAVTEFLQENEIEYERNDDLFRGERIELWARDLFAVEPDRVGPVHYILDRAALIALPPEASSRYVEHLASFTIPESRILLITLEYDQSTMNGPPFSVGPERVRELFEPRFEVEHLEGTDILADYPNFFDRGLKQLKEHCFLLVRRDRPEPPRSRP